MDLDAGYHTHLTEIDPLIARIHPEWHNCDPPRQASFRLTR